MSAAILKYFGNVLVGSVDREDCITLYTRAQALLELGDTAWPKLHILLSNAMRSALGTSQTPLTKSTCVVACLLLRPLLSLSTVGHMSAASDSSFALHLTLSIGYADPVSGR